MVPKVFEPLKFDCTMTIAEPAVSLQCCKALVGRTFYQSEIRKKAIMMYQIVKGLVEIPAGQYVTATGIPTRGHHQQLLAIYCYINAYKGPFIPSTARLWNVLLANNISVPTLKDFKLDPCLCRYPKTVMMNMV